MATIMIIDGYNALNSHPKGKRALGRSLSEARSFLIGICGEFASERQDVRGIKLYFDGDDRYRDDSRADLFPGVEVIFSSTDTCDEEMIEAAREWSPIGDVIVVTDDNYVRNRTRGHASLMRPVRLFERRRKRRSVRKVLKNKKVIKEEIRKDINREYGERLGLG